MSKEKNKLLPLIILNTEFQKKFKELMEKLSSEDEACDSESESPKEQTEDVVKENLTIRSLRTQLQNQKETIINQQRTMWDLREELKQKKDLLERVKETEKVQFQKLSKIREIL